MISAILQKLRADARPLSRWLAFITIIVSMAIVGGVASLVSVNQQGATNNPTESAAVKTVSAPPDWRRVGGEYSLAYPADWYAGRWKLTAIRSPSTLVALSTVDLGTVGEPDARCPSWPTTAMATLDSTDLLLTISGPFHVGAMRGANPAGTLLTERELQPVRGPATCFAGEHLAVYETSLIADRRGYRVLVVLGDEARSLLSLALRALATFSPSR